MTKKETNAGQEVKHLFNVVTKALINTPPYVLEWSSFIINISFIYFQQCIETFSNYPKHLGFTEETYEFLQIKDEFSSLKISVNGTHSVFIIKVIQIIL